jgi:PhzF family phenazine biosynthesis protein
MRIFVVDAFTDRPFRGNPAGVCLLEDAAFPPDDWMLRVAAEMRHSETAFVRPLGTLGKFELRWFTPEVEVELCGHATLAAAHVLFDEWTVADKPIEFHTKSGVLTVVRTPQGLELDFPAVPAVRLPEPPSGLAAALGVEPEWVGRNAQSDMLAVVADAGTVRRLRPEQTLLKEIDARGVCVTALADASDTGATEDFVSRFFAPAVGIPEDPVTGSAHCMLAPYWAEQLGRTSLTGRQLSEREGVVRTTLRGDRVLLAGEAVTVLKGELRV